MMNEELTLEWYELTKKCVRSMVNAKFQTLGNMVGVEDLAQEAFLTFTKRGFYERYDGVTCTKAYYLMTALKNFMLDEYAKARKHMAPKNSYEIRLDAPVDEDEGYCISDIITDSCTNDPCQEIINNEIINRLPRSRGVSVPVWGDSPLLGNHIEFSEYSVAFHLMNGYTASEIAAMFKNPHTGQPLATSSVSRILSDVKDWVRTYMRQSEQAFAL